MLAIAPHRIAVPSAKRLASLIEKKCLVIKSTNSRFNWDRPGLVINWGRSDLPVTRKTVINHPSLIQNASNKIRFLQKMERDNIPAPTLLDESQCMSLLSESKKILLRTPFGFGGRGITIVSTPDQFNGISGDKFAVRFFPKSAEFRVHVWKGEVIHLTQKRAARGRERDVQERCVWSHSNGWVHCRNGVEEPDGLRQLAINAVNACSLDFGAVDVMLNRDGALRVLEVNTAPGVSGQVADAYVEAIRGL
jgi:hypothetical protein